VVSELRYLWLRLSVRDPTHPPRPSAADETGERRVFRRGQSAAEAAGYTRRAHSRLGCTGRVPVSSLQLGDGEGSEQH
jgi:hypothetical protein